MRIMTLTELVDLEPFFARGENACLMGGYLDRWMCGGNRDEGKVGKVGENEI